LLLYQAGACFDFRRLIGAKVPIRANRQLGTAHALGAVATNCRYCKNSALQKTVRKPNRKQAKETDQRDLQDQETARNH
jgi:hypothetical protein